MTKENAYEIPENYLPAGYRCLKVFVPDDMHYIEQFWTAYEYFCQWTAWQRDNLKRGRLVAAKWRIGFEQARQFFETFGGCEMAITGIRMNPANTCELQYSTDNGSSWVTVADLSDCAGAGGINGLKDITIENNIIVGRDQCGDTVPLGPQSQSQYSGVVEPLYPGDVPGDNCVAGANAANYLNNELHRWANIRLTVIGYVQIVLDILQGLAVIFSEGAWSIPIWETFAIAYEWSEDWWNDIEAIDVEAELAAIISAYYELNGTMTKTGHQALVDELKTHYSGPPTTNSTESAWFIVTFIVNRLGPVGMARIAKAGGITEADCSGSNYHHSWDFALSDGAWSRFGAPEIDPSTITALYRTGQQWESILYNGAGTDPSNYRGLSIIKTPNTTTNLKRVKFTYDYHQGTFNGIGAPKVLMQLKQSGTWGGELNVQDDEGDGLVWDFSGDWENVEAIRLILLAGYDGTDPYGDPTGTAKLHEVQVWGTGIDPF